MFQRSTFQCSHVQRSTFVTTQAAWRSAIEIAPGRLFAGRPHRRGFNRMPELSSAIEIAPGRLFAGRPHRRGFNRMPELRLPGVQRLKSPLEGFSPGVHTGAVSTAQAAWRSAIEIAPGRLFAGRPPAWTLPQRPHRRSPGAKRPLRRGLWRLRNKSAIRLLPSG